MLKAPTYAGKNLPAGIHRREVVSEFPELVHHQTLHPVRQAVGVSLDVCRVGGGVAASDWTRRQLCEYNTCRTIHILGNNMV